MGVYGEEGNSTRRNNHLNVSTSEKKSDIYVSALWRVVNIIWTREKNETWRFWN